MKYSDIYIYSENKLLKNDTIPYCLTHKTLIHVHISSICIDVNRMR